jgi:hypothetical protein
VARFGTFPFGRNKYFFHILPKLNHEDEYNVNDLDHDVVRILCFLSEFVAFECAKSSVMER